MPGAFSASSVRAPITATDREFGWRSEPAVPTSEFRTRFVTAHAQRVRLRELPGSDRRPTIRHADHWPRRCLRSRDHSSLQAVRPVAPRSPTTLAGGPPSGPEKLVRGLAKLRRDDPTVRPKNKIILVTCTVSGRNGPARGHRGVWRAPMDCLAAAPAAASFLSAQMSPVSFFRIAI